MTATGTQSRSTQKSARISPRKFGASLPKKNSRFLVGPRRGSQSRHGPANPVGQFGLFTVENGEEATTESKRKAGRRVKIYEAHDAAGVYFVEVPSAPEKCLASRARANEFLRDKGRRMKNAAHVASVSSRSNGSSRTSSEDAWRLQQRRYYLVEQMPS